MSLAGISSARSLSILARPASPELVEVEPGEIFTMSFRVTNSADTREELTETLRMPEGWRVVMPMFEFYLEPGSQTTRLVVVQTARTAPAGTHEIAYTVTSLRDYTLTDTATVGAVLPDVYNLSLVVEGSAPEQVIAGEPFEFNVRLSNEGNSELPVRVKAELPAEGRVIVNPDSFHLGPGKSRIIKVTARADPAAYKLQRQHVHLQAAADKEKDGRPLSARLSVPVDIVPLVAGEDMYYRYPVEVTGYLGGDDEGRSLQLGIQGSGHLDEARKRRLDFVLQGPDQQDKGALGKRDEYRAHYHEPLFSVSAGDRSYALSELTSWYRYGRGLGVDVHPPDRLFGAGIYYVKDRWSYQKRSDTAGYISFSPQPWADLRLNLMTLHHESWKTMPSSRDHIASLQGKFNFRRDDNLEVEVGCSKKDRGRTGRGTAWRSVYRGKAFNDVHYSFFGRRAGPDFAGRYNDTAHYSGTVAFPISKEIRGSISCSRYDSNLDKRPERGAASRENFYSGGFRIKMPKRWTMNMDYHFYDRRDAQPIPTLEFQEHGLRAGLGRSAGPLSYRGQVRRVQTNDRLAGEIHRGWNYDFFTTYMPARTLFFTFNGSFGDNNPPADSRLLRRGRNLGGSVRWHPASNFSAYLNYSRYDQKDIDQPHRERVESDYYRAGLEYRLPNNHRVGFDIWRSEENQGNSRTSCFLKYTIPLSLPLGRKKSVGSLTGRVYRSDEPGNPGVEGAVIYVDGTATRTDGSGRFTFETLRPGEYSLKLDERTIGLDWVPVDPSSTKVTVAGAVTAESSIALTKAATLSGRLIVVPGNEGAENNRVTKNSVVGLGEKYVNSDAAPNDNGLGNILVEISRLGDIRRTVTNNEGFFLFEQLQQGEWAFKVYDHNLPEQHDLEEAAGTISVRPGEKNQTIFRVLPRVRKIRFIDEGVVEAVPPSGNKP